MEKKTLTWFHFSDLHMQEDDKFNRNIVLEALWNDVRNFIERGLIPDIIVFTGDIAYHGYEHEYELARKDFFEPLIDITNVGKDRIFIVPGNHDADRTIIDSLRNPLESTGKRDDINKILLDGKKRRLMLSPFESYDNFVKSYLPHYSSIDNPSFSFTHTISVDEYIIGIIGLNSAWLSGFGRDENRNIKDFGNLAIGEPQVRSVFSEESHLNITLVHHPFEYLLEDDRNVIENYVISKSSIILRGHLHTANVLAVSTLSGDIVVIPSGSVFDSRKSPNGYSIVQIDLQDGEGIIYLRGYNDQRQEWQKDRNSTGEEMDGSVRFRLPDFWYTKTVRVDSAESSKSLINYNITFTETCRKNLSSLSLSEENLIDMVQSEFRGHLNYFRYDLEEYPLPVRTNYIVYLNKLQNNIEFRNIIPCSKNETKLASWNDILNLYRKCTRISYREDPNVLLSNKGMVNRISKMHTDLKTRIIKHFEKFNNIRVDPIEIHLNNSKGTDGMAHNISFHLHESKKSCFEALDLIRSLDQGDISVDNAIGMLTVEFERSLQHIHKIILRHPPVDNFTEID